MDFETLLQNMADTGAADLYMKEGNTPFLRINGCLEPQGEQRLTHDDVEQLALTLLGPTRVEAFHRELELNFAFDRGVMGRFRANTLLQQGKLALVIRRIRNEILSFAELNLPAQALTMLAEQPKGLVLVTGATSNGKSSTIASMVNHINCHSSKHIVTLEDPIEFVFEEDQSIINQREIGTDTRSYQEALRNVLRQSPDVIYISDIRDDETMSSAVMAAEAGNLVMSCLHTVNVINTIERMITFFPPHQQEQARLRLSLILQGIISLRLLPRADGKGLVPACEILIGTPTVRELIREGRTTELYPYLEDGGMFGMQTFNRALAQLVQTGTVTADAAKSHADSPNELELLLNDIRPTKSASDSPFQRF